MSIRIRPPKGYTFEIEEDDYYCEGGYNYIVYLKKNGYTWGRVSLLPRELNYNYRTGLSSYAEGVFDTHSWLHESLRGKGLGALIYAKAIHFCHTKGFKVRSSGGSSRDAQRVWKSKTLRKFFIVKRGPKRGRKKQNKNSLYYDDNTTWYAYPKV